MKNEIILILLMIGFPLSAQDENVQRDILKYGTDNEITELIKTLKKDNTAYLDTELINLVQTTKNTVIKSQVIVFFSEREKEGLENEALYLLENRNEAESANILAAIEYLGKVKYSGARDILFALLEQDDDQWNAALIRALSMIPEDTENGEMAEYLIDYYEHKNPPEQIQRELILALGKTGSGRAAEFLAERINENTRMTITIAALNAAAQRGGAALEEAVIGALSSKDPNVRAAAVEALGCFDSETAGQALLDAFRDSYYKTRLAAVKAAGKRQLAAAVPYLKFRAERDEVPAVQEESVRALAAIAGAECEQILEALFDEKKTSDRLKNTIALMLVSLDADRYTPKIIIRLDEAKRLNQKQLYNGLVTALCKAQTNQVKDLAGRLFASKEAVDKAFALEITAQNRFSEYEPEVRRLANETSSGLARKAKEVLEKL